MKKIKVKKYKIEKHEHFYKNESIGFLNEYEHLDLRCQIKENKVLGYFLACNGIVINIDTDGMLENCPDNLYATSRNLLNTLWDV